MKKIIVRSIILAAILYNPLGAQVDSAKDFNDFTNVFCDVAAVLNKMKKTKSSDPNWKPNPITDAIIDQGGNAGIRYCNTFSNINNLIALFDERRSGEKSLIAIARKLNKASECLQKTQNDKERQKCLAEAIKLTYEMIKPFIDNIIGYIKDKSFYEGALLHMSHIEELIPEILLEQNPKLKEGLETYAMARSEKVLPAITKGVLPVFDMLRLLNISMESMAGDQISAEERKGLLDIPPVPLEIDDSDIKEETDKIMGEDIVLSDE